MLRPAGRRLAGSDAMKMGFLLGVAVSFGLMLSWPLVQTAIAADQPHMQEALHDLYHAEHDIEIADQYQDHGGYAGVATVAIRQAIGDIQAGIAYRDEHGP
jgi:hypothetical protein